MITFVMVLTSFASAVVNLRVSISLDTGTFLFLLTSHVKKRLSSRSSSVIRWTPLLSKELSLALDECHSSKLSLSMLKLYDYPEFTRNVMNSESPKSVLFKSLTFFPSRYCLYYIVFLKRNE